MNGGYQIVDLKGVTLSGTAATIGGVYAAIEGTNKAILLTGINIGGTEYHDAFIAPTVSSTNYTWTVYGKTFTVTDDDEVTVA